MNRAGPSRRALLMAVLAAWAFARAALQHRRRAGEQSNQSDRHRRAGVSLVRDGQGALALRRLYFTKENTNTGAAASCGKLDADRPVAGLVRLRPDRPRVATRRFPRYPWACLPGRARPWKRWRKTGSEQCGSERPTEFSNQCKLTRRNRRLSHNAPLRRRGNHFRAPVRTVGRRARARPRAVRIARGRCLGRHVSTSGAVSRQWRATPDVAAELRPARSGMVQITALGQDCDGNLWVSTDDVGVLRLAHGGSVTCYRMERSGMR